MKDISQRFHSATVSIQGVEDSSIAGRRGLFEHSSQYTCVSAVKRHDTRDTLVIRLFNLRNETTRDVLTFGLDVCSAWRTNLLEERADEVGTASAREMPIILEPHEIVTLEVEFAG